MIGKISEGLLRPRSTVPDSDTTPLVIAARARLPWSVVALGLLVRLALAPYTAVSNDAAVWFHTSLSGFYGLHLYDRPGFSYPPLWGYCLQLIGFVVRMAGAGPNFFGVDNPAFLRVSTITGEFATTVTSPAFNLIFKSVLFGFDLATGLIIYRFVFLFTGNAQRSRYAFAAWFLNPYVIYVSAVHGAFDGLVGCAIVATVVLLLEGRPFFAGVVWVIGILLKLSPAVLGLQLLVALLIVSAIRYRFADAILAQIGGFALGATLGAAALLLPEILFGSPQGMVHNVFARAQESITVGGLSLMGLRHLKPWSWLFLWAYIHTPLVLRVAAIAQALAMLAWAVWTVVVGRHRLVFGLLTGTVGTLSSLTLVSPFSNPIYVLWWLPLLVVAVFTFDRAYWHLAVLSAAPLLFSIAILGPAGPLAPLVTYTHLISPYSFSQQLIDWYTSPGQLWGVTRADDFFGVSVVVVVGTLMSLFVLWSRMAIDPRATQPKLRT